MYYITVFILAHVSSDLKFFVFFLTDLKRQSHINCPIALVAVTSSLSKKRLNFLFTNARSSLNFQIRTHQSFHLQHCVVLGVGDEEAFADTKDLSALAYLKDFDLTDFGRQKQSLLTNVLFG